MASSIRAALSVFPPPDTAQYWRPIENGLWICAICKDGIQHTRDHAIRHHNSEKHSNALRRQILNQLTESRNSDAPGEVDHSVSSGDVEDIPAATSSAVSLLLGDMSVPDLDSYMEDDDHPADSEAGPNVHVGAALFAQHMIGYLNEEELSADEEIERSEGARTPDDQHDNDNISRKRSRSETRSNKTSTEWYPWPDKIACTIDILMNLPRSVFSQRQLDIFLWVLAANGIADTPSASSMQRLQTLLQTMCGIRTLQYKGALGHNYFVNSLADIIAQEMANPRVRPHLQFYPEDNGKSVNEYWQASHWREEADPSKLTPLAIIGSQHFFVFEPCLLRDGRACMPVRWFRRHGLLYATAWPLQAIVRDTDSGWVVSKYRTIEVSQGEFLVAFGSWSSSRSTRDLPSAKAILGYKDSVSGVLQEWTLTDPSQGNRWRVLAGGARVYSFPIWLYCDDTSGNLSKKWNAHNSFLFTPAGLPRSHVHDEYNVHFLCTSNTAPPLEMLDGIVDQLEYLYTLICV